MKVESLYIGELRRLPRLNQETISLDEGSRVTDMIDKLTDAYGNSALSWIERAAMSS